jgi:hypothetical protein
MLTPDAKRRAMSGGVFLLPIVLVLATGKLLAPVKIVAAAGAAPPPIDVSLIVDPPLAAPAGAELAAMERIAHLAAAPFPPTPFYHQPPGETPGIPVSSGGETGSGSVANDLPDFSIQAIMGSSRGATALINNRRYAIGDAYEETTWIVAAIDPIARTVTFEEKETARTVTRSVSTSR